MPVQLSQAKNAGSIPVARSTAPARQLVRLDVVVARMLHIDRRHVRHRLTPSLATDRHQRPSLVTRQSGEIVTNLVK